MPDSAILEPPVMGAPDALDQAMSDQVKHDNGILPPKEAPKPQVTEKPVEKPVQKPVDKTLTEKPVEVGKPKDKNDPLAKLDNVQPTEDDINKQSRWMQLKAAEKERDELKTKHQEYEKQIGELKAKALADDDLKRYEELKIKERAWEVEKTPEWKKQIAEPFQQREAYTNRIAEFYKMDPDSLWSVMDIADPLERGDKIDDLIAKANELRGEAGEKVIPNHVGPELAKIGNDLQIIYGAMARHRQDALERGSALDAEKGQLTEKQKAEEKQQYDVAHREVYDTLGKKLPSIFSDDQIKIEGVSAADAVKTAVPADNPRGRAYQAQAGEILPYMTHKLMAAEAKIREFEKEAADRVAANPNMQQTDVKLPTEKNKNQYSSIDDAISDQRQYAPHTLGM